MTQSLSTHRVAVVGAGIAGMGAALRLAQAGCEVTVIEAEPRLGGHAHTRDVAGPDGDIAVDTGFIVFNHTTYPLLTALFEQLQVPTVPTGMSFSVCCAECGLQLAGGSTGQLLHSIRRQPVRVLRLAAGIIGFRRAGARAVASGLDDDITLREWARDGGLSELTVSHYLIPLTASVWSTPPGEALDMPAATTLQFLDNHGLLSARRPQWYTVKGGSRVYVEAVRAELERLGATFRLGSPVREVRRTTTAGGSVQITSVDGWSDTFDGVVLATHGDQTRELLAEPTDLEHEVLSGVSYTNNHVVLHRDLRPLPPSRKLWAAWNYQLAGCSADAGPATLSYQMNLLQHLPNHTPLSVTVNPAEGSIDDELVEYDTHYAHPRYDVRMRASQRLVDQCNEQSAATGIVLCGAWRTHGFHEDGLRSGDMAAHSLLAALETRVQAGAGA